MDRFEVNLGKVLDNIEVLSKDLEYFDTHGVRPTGEYKKLVNSKIDAVIEVLIAFRKSL